MHIRECRSERNPWTYFLAPLVLGFVLIGAGASESAAVEVDAGRGEDGSRAEARRSVTVVGVGAIVSSGQYLGEKTRVIPVPVIYARRGRWFFEGIRGGYVLLDGEQHRVSAVLAPRFGPFEAKDDPALSGMRDRRTTLEGGLSARIQPVVDHPLSLRFEALGDLLGEHEGGQLSAAIAWDVDRGWWAVTPKAGVNWYSSSLMQHLAGVDPSEARAGRPAYAPGSEASVELGLQARFPLSRTWGVMAIGSWERFGSRFSASPVVRSASSWTGILGIGRVF